jgi:hypothetical protein
MNIKTLTLLLLTALPLASCYWGRGDHHDRYYGDEGRHYADAGDTGSVGAAGISPTSVAATTQAPR